MGLFLLDYKLYFFLKKIKCFDCNVKWFFSFLLLFWLGTLIVGSVESSRTCIIILSEGHESPHAAPMES